MGLVEHVRYCGHQHSGMAPKRLRGIWKLMRDINRLQRGWPGDAPVVMASGADRWRALGIRALGRQHAPKPGGVAFFRAAGKSVA